MAKISKAIIPVAGLGTRFLPATKAQPKEMLPLVDKPVIQYVVEEAAAAGISNVIFITGRGKQAIENHFDVAYELETVLGRKGKYADIELIHNLHSRIQFAYVRQGEALGLGHAIRCAKPVVKGETVAVLLGDDVFDEESPALAALIEAHEKTGMSVVGVQEVPNQHIDRYGIVTISESDTSRGNVTDIIEKPLMGTVSSNLAVVGRYILTPEAFEILDTISPGHSGEYQLTDALSILAAKGRLAATKIPQKRYDTGNKLDYLKACVEFALKRSEFCNDFRQFIVQTAETIQANEATLINLDVNGVI